MVPATFDICWKCRTTKDGGKTDHEPVTFEEDLDARRSDEELAPTELDAETSWMNDDWIEADKRQSQSVCPRYGSAKIMLGVSRSCLRQNGNGAAADRFGVFEIFDLP